MPRNQDIDRWLPLTPQLGPIRIGSGGDTAKFGLYLAEAIGFVEGVHVEQGLGHGGGGSARLDRKDALAGVADLVLVVGGQGRDAGDAAVGIRPRAGDDVV